MQTDTWPRSSHDLDYLISLLLAMKNPREQAELCQKILVSIDCKWDACDLERSEGRVKWLRAQLVVWSNLAAAAPAPEQPPPLPPARETPVNDYSSITLESKGVVAIHYSNGQDPLRLRPVDFEGFLNKKGEPGVLWLDFLDILKGNMPKIAKNLSYINRAIEKRLNLPKGTNVFSSVREPLIMCKLGPARIKPDATASKKIRSVDNAEERVFHNGKPCLFDPREEQRSREKNRRSPTISEKNEAEIQEMFDEFSGEHNE